MVAYRLIWLKVLFFLLGPAVTQFLAIQQTIDLDTKWPAMGFFARLAFWVGIWYPGFTNLIAFIDQSLPKAREELAKKRSANGNAGDTQHFVKETGQQIS